jgi:hypothetical protein
MPRETPDIIEFISAAELEIAVEIGNVLKRGLVSKERIAGVLLAYAFEMVRGDDRATLFLLQEILRLNDARQRQKAGCSMHE